MCPVLAPDSAAAPAPAVASPPAVALQHPPAPTATAAAAADCRYADIAARQAGRLAQALRDHHDQPDADRAAQVLRCIDEASTAACSTSGTGEAVDLAALQACLGPADALVVYGQQDEELLACVLRAAGVQVFHRLARWPDVQAAWRLARFQLDAQRHGAGPPPAHWPHLYKRAQARLRALHALVWAPLADTLSDVRRVLLVPGDGLAGLPFAALQDGLTCVAQRHLLAEVPSLALALRGLSPPAGLSNAASTGPIDLGVAVLGLGEDGVRSGANLAGRTQALLASGTRRVLVHRWRVDDAVITAFMDRFQQQRRRGRRPAEALSEAQAGLMVNHPHPAFWAGFVLYGGW